MVRRSRAGCRRVEPGCRGRAGYPRRIRCADARGRADDQWPSWTLTAVTARPKTAVASTNNQIAWRRPPAACRRSRPTPTIWQGRSCVAIQMATSSEIAVQPPEPAAPLRGSTVSGEDRGAAHEAPAQLVGGEPLALADVLPDEVGEHVGHPRRDADAGHELEAVAVGHIRGRHEGQRAEDQHGAVGRGGDEVGRPLARHPAQPADEAGHGRRGQPRRSAGGVDRAPTVPSDGTTPSGSCCAEFGRFGLMRRRGEPKRVRLPASCQRAMPRCWRRAWSAGVPVGQRRAGPAAGAEVREGRRVRVVLARTCRSARCTPTRSRGVAVGDGGAVVAPARARRIADEGLVAGEPVVGPEALGGDVDRPDVPAASIAGVAGARVVVLPSTVKAMAPLPAGVMAMAG